MLSADTLHAQLMTAANEANASLPRQLDASTTFMAESVDGLKVTYVFETSAPFSSYSLANIKRNVCGKADVLNGLSNGMTFAYEYHHGGVVLGRFDLTSCG